MKGLKVVKVARLYLTLCNPMDYIVQEFSRNAVLHSLSLLQGISQPRDQTQVSCIAGRFFTIWAIRLNSVGAVIQITQCVSFLISVYAYHHGMFLIFYNFSSLMCAKWCLTVKFALTWLLMRLSTYLSIYGLIVFFFNELAIYIFCLSTGCLY